MQYAPVVITTLNRYEHFKRCLESLERCTGADKTEVYVGLDYPPSEKYIDGWKKIDGYLRQKEQSSGFKKLIVYRRETNYFFSEKGNLKTLVSDLPQEYDSYIATEDDNEFSPCFLEYMNQNLEKYKDDSTVFSICGFLSPKEDLPSFGGYSQFMANRYVAWGVGKWKTKSVEYNAFACRNNVIKLVKSRVVRNFFEETNNEWILCGLVKMSKGGHLLGDVIVDAYLVYNNMRCVFPTISMVRNNGMDGSGQHCGATNDYDNQVMCNNFTYQINMAPQSYSLEFERRRYKTCKYKKLTSTQYLHKFSWYIYKYTGLFFEFKYAAKLKQRLFRHEKING